MFGARHWPTAVLTCCFPSTAVWRLCSYRAPVERVMRDCSQIWTASGSCFSLSLGTDEIFLPARLITHHLLRLLGFFVRVFMTLIYMSHRSIVFMCPFSLGLAVTQEFTLSWCEVDPLHVEHLPRYNVFHCIVNRLWVVIGHRSAGQGMCV